MSTNQRPSWDAVRIEQAKSLAQRSLCARSKVGAIITDRTARIIGEGYNGPPHGFQHGNQPCNVWCKRASELSIAPDYSDCPALHAEANALMMSDRTLREQGTIYITSHVCFGCAKLIANSGIHRVVVATDRADTHRDPQASYRFLQECGLIVDLDNVLMSVRLGNRE